MEIKRDAYLEQLKIRKDNGMIKIITGIRRCGKSFLLFVLFKKYLLESGVDEYSCAMKSHFRKFGNQMSGSGNHLCEFTRVMFYLDRIPLASICHVQDQCL